MAKVYLQRVVIIPDFPCLLIRLPSPVGYLNNKYVCTWGAYTVQGWEFALLLKIAYFFKSDPERCTRTICSLCSLQKSDLSNLLRSLITKEWLWAISSYPSLKKSKSAIHSKKRRENRTLALSLTKKWAICSKNQWANSQPWAYMAYKRQMSL